MRAPVIALAPALLRAASRLRRVRRRVRLAGRARSAARILVLVDQTSRPPERRGAPAASRDGASSWSSARAGRERVVLARVSRPDGSAGYGGGCSMTTATPDDAWRRESATAGCPNGQIGTTGPRSPATL